VHHNSTKNSRGVAVLISKQAQYKILSTAADPQENILMLRVIIKNAEFVIGAIYGPNVDNNCREFFNFISNTLNDWENLPYILGGDWNATFSCLPVDKNPDILFMRQLPSITRSRNVNDLCERYGITDPFRILHPDVWDFTYNPSGSVRKNRSRIDFFSFLNVLITYVNSCTVAQSFCSKTFDHKAIFLSFKKKKTKCCPIVHNSTVEHQLSDQIVKLSVHKTTLLAIDDNVGPVTAAVLNDELAILNNIEVKINQIILVKRKLAVARTREVLEKELRELKANLREDWDAAAPLEYLLSFNKKDTSR
jgi:exonuclease III